MKLIIDTDIGTDVDDALAIAHAVKSGIDLELITTVHGDTETRAKIAKKLLNLLGKDVPVHMGEETPLKQRHIYTSGREGQGFLENDDVLDIERDGIDALAETILRNRGNINIAAIGPLTNIAKAFQTYPELPGAVNHLYLMGNAVVRSSEYFINYRSHNFKVDPEAVDIVMAAEVDKTIVTTGVCKLNFLTSEDLQQMGKHPSQAVKYLAAAAQEWMDYISYPVAYLYDPLTVHHHIDQRVTSQVCYAAQRTSVTTHVSRDFSRTFLDSILRGNNL
ncbi:nucleoside hydrolase [Candidatus Woesearchaeota archaeon]|jgi:purine nucleosidase|nr:nucleoside hydrolase [Candidatus Woesearchaeota archaeon]MBT3537994.1 nucleoside hydrolase [Candidatus Woesearchaeota archaeon]MBT4697348.1 nucleoside hydrolase [Candidatus Woesearchaeota archaeon]MBT4717069.1 nucleoside hydrolase [Candidatus Woesearchaeota archaeon]MBT7105663.1 nucleoside hydrolase [Candidatus Woesearchaeota archaeon]